MGEVSLASSVLASTKKLLGIQDEYTEFDQEIIMNINSVLGKVYQLGVTKEAKIIEDREATWTDIIGDRKDLEIIKTYIYKNVKLAFDPPSSSFVLQSLKEQIAEEEFRLSAVTDYSFE